MCTQMQGPEVCSCFDSSTFTTQLEEDINRAYMTTLAFVAPFDPAWCEVSNQNVCQLSEATQSCCCQPEVGEYRKCLVETVLPTRAGVTVQCSHSCTKEEGDAGGGSAGIIAGVVVVIVLLLAGGAGFWFWRRRRQQATDSSKDDEKVEGSVGTASIEEKKNIHDNSDIKGDSANNDGQKNPNKISAFLGFIFSSNKEGNNASKGSATTKDSKDMDLEAGDNSSSCSSSSSFSETKVTSKLPEPAIYATRTTPSKAATKRVDDESDSSSSSGSSADSSSSSDDDESSGNGTDMLAMIQKKAELLKKAGQPRRSVTQEPLQEEKTSIVDSRPTDIVAIPSPTKDIQSTSGGSKQHEKRSASELKKKRNAIESWNKDRKQGSKRSLESYTSADDHREDIIRRGDSRRDRRAVHEEYRRTSKRSSTSSQEPSSRYSASRSKQDNKEKRKNSHTSVRSHEMDDDLQERRKATAIRIAKLEEQNKILQYDLEQACKKEEEARKRRQASRVLELHSDEEIRKEKEAAALRIAELEEQNRRLQRKLEQKTTSRKSLDDEEKEERRRIRKEREERREAERLAEYYRLTGKIPRGEKIYSTSWNHQSNTKRRLDSDGW